MTDHNRNNSVWTRKSRTLTWLPFLGSPKDHFWRRSMSAQLPISTPTLIFTTNVKVAQSQSLGCGEVTKVLSRPTSEQGSPWRRTETLNLCKAKIRSLTGHGHGKVKRKSLYGSGNVITKENSVQRGPLLRTHCALMDLNYIVDSDDNNPYYGSMSKMSFLRSKSSFFNFKAASKDDEKDTGNEAQQKIVLPQPPDTPQLPSRVKRPLQKTNYWPVMRKSNPEPMTLTRIGGGAEYVSAQPVQGYPRGVKATGMHSETMTFASAPPMITGLPTPRKDSQMVVWPDEEEDDIQDSDNISAAPIYSPSKEDLREYARQTPLAAKDNTNTSLPPEKIQIETPTKAPGESMKRVLKKSKSSLSFFRRSKKSGSSEELSTRRPELRGPGEFQTGGPETPRRDIALPFQPTTPSPLRYMIPTRPQTSERQPTVGSPRRARDAPDKRRGVVGMPGPDGGAQDQAWI